MSDIVPDPRDDDFHPRRQTILTGHEEAETLLRTAHASGRLHHAWLITGPRGIGKATLAYRFARFLLRHGDPSSAPPGGGLGIAETDTVFRQVASGSHPDLFTLQRAFDIKTKKIKTETSVADARKAEQFFSMTAAYGGYRVCVIDSVDDMSSEAANALLKTLEEPPERAVFLLVNHSPGVVLRTIRSRCIRLDLQPLNGAQVEQVVSRLRPGEEGVAEAAALSGGSPGRAMGLMESAGAKAFQSFLQLTDRLPRMDKLRQHDLAETLTGRAQDSDYNLFCELMGSWIAQRARENAMENRAAAKAWAEIHGQIAYSIRQANALNLDRRQVLLEAFSAIEAAANA